MYEKFYGFSEKPFSLLPDPGYLFLSRKHSMALAMLQYGLGQQAGFTVIAGEVGSGKTTLIRQVLNQLEDDITLGLITNTHSSFGELMQWVCLAFDLTFKGKDKVELYGQFQEFIIGEYAANRRTVLIIDEAQNLSIEALEELRLLSNINADKDQLLQLILVGQPELRRKLKRPELRQFAQRVSVAYFLGPLNEVETAGYVQHRLRVAGGDENLFEERAIKRVQRYSNGVPRIINSICDMALVYGFAEHRRSITREIIDEVAKDKASGGLFGDEASGESGSGGENQSDESVRPVHRIR